MNTRPMLSGIDCIDALRQGLDLLASAAAPRAAFHKLIYEISVHFKSAKTVEERAHSGVADGLIQSLKDEIVETLGSLESTTTVDRTLQLLTCIKEVFRQGDPPTYQLAKTKLKKLKAHSKLQGSAATFVKNVGGGNRRLSHPCRSKPSTSWWPEPGSNWEVPQATPIFPTRGAHPNRASRTREVQPALR